MSAVPADLRLTSPWRSALPLFAVLLVAILLLYRGTALAMADIWWRSETFAHCLLVVPITLWLVWRKRQVLAALTPRPQPLLLLLLLALAALWLVADVMVVNVVAQFAFVGMVVLAVPAALGLEVAMAILFPLLFLFFGVPFGEFMLPTMMEATADFTVWALQMTGVPVYREGQQFLIPSGSWSVIDECSGVRYLMASFMVGTLFAYLNYRSYKRRVVFMLVSIAVPIVANWLRAYIIVMMAHLSGNKLAVGVDHILYGWVFFGIIVFIMFMVGARWSQAEAPTPLPQAADADTTASARAVRNTVFAALAVAALPHLVLALLQRSENAAAPAALALPAQLAPGWTSEGAKLAAWTPEFSPPSAQAGRVYAGPQASVGVYIAYYRGQNEERKLVSSLNKLVGMRDREWSLPVAPGLHDVASGSLHARFNTSEIAARVTMDAAPPQRLLVWRSYWIDGRFVNGDMAAKLAGGLARLRGHGDEGAQLVLYANAGTVDASRAALQAFVQANLGELNALLLRTQAAR